MKRRILMAAGLSPGVDLLVSRRSQAQSGTLNLYSARHYNTDEALYGNFADLSGIKINRVDAEPDPLVERLKAEGDKSPCDVLITTDAGRIERARHLRRSDERAVVPDRARGYVIGRRPRGPRASSPPAAPGPRWAPSRAAASWWADPQPLAGATPDRWPAAGWGKGFSG